MDSPVTPIPSFRDRFAIRVGFFRQARRIWNCLALHWVVDDDKKTVRMTFAIPGLLTAVIESPMPLPASWSAALAGGVGERAEYGLWHDYYQTKLQWRTLLDQPAKGSEWRRVHEHPTIASYRQETLLSGLVGDVGTAWATANRVAKWQLVIATTHEEILYSLVPDLYDHQFVLRAVTEDSVVHETRLKADLSPQITVMDTFVTLTEQIDLTKPAIPPAPSAT